MAATIIINESNGAGETVTTGISTGHFRGATDSPNLGAPVDDPIALSANSYEKWWKLEWDSGTAVQVDTIRVHSSGAEPTDTLCKTSADSGTPSDATYATPSTSTSSVATNNIPTSDPAVATVAGTLTATSQESGYVVHQVQVGASATAGFASRTITFSWREIA